MSKIGKMPITIPPNVDVKIEGNTVKVKGPKGELSMNFNPEFVDVIKEDNVIRVIAKGERKRFKMMHGTTRALINNLVKGVTEGFRKTLVVRGTGYKVQQEGKGLKILVGYSHPVIVNPPEGITLKALPGNKILVEGIDKHLVGQVAANIRAIREPDSYKGKGIIYEGEVLRLKPGKSGKAK